MRRQISALSYGSDVIVELLHAAGIEYAAFNPGATFRGIHDSLVHTPGAPLVVLCMHESVSVSIAHAYAKAAGKPMAVMIHNVVGLQNASMAIYNAWCDRAPIILVGGTGPRATTRRRPWIDWIHTANVQGNLVRDFVKWDDEPHDLAAAPESFARALTTAISAPAGPVYVCYDVTLQEDATPEGFRYQGIEHYPTPSAPAADPHSIVSILTTLRAARHPVILAGHIGDTQQSMDALVELAEALGAPVLDTGVRLACPTDHPLNGTGVDELLAEADVVLALDADDLQSRLGSRWATSDEPRKLTIINVTLANLRVRSWSQDYQALVPAMQHITSTADAAVEAIRYGLSMQPLDPQSVSDRRDRLINTIAVQRRAWQDEGASAEADGAVALTRLIHLVGRAVSGRRFVLANGTNGRLEHRQWGMREPRQYLGWAAGGGLGYGVGATIGSALANDDDVISIDIQADGDLLFLPSALWTAAHLRLRTLFVVNNNRQYGNTVEHATQIAAARHRDTELRYIGAGLGDPAVDLAGLARSFGVWAAGPIVHPRDLKAQLVKAVAVLDSGRPALLDVITPGF